MIGDPLYISEKDYKTANNIVDKINSKIILIGGGSGTHKSEVAYCVQLKFNNKHKSSFVLSLDDYYTTHATIRMENRQKQGIESVGLSEIDWESIKRIYEDFNNEKNINFKRTHRFLEAIEFNTIESSKIDYLIIEGLYANYLKKFYTNNFSVFLEGTPDQTLKFRKRRNKENENNKFRQEVVQKEFNVVCQLKRYADLIIPFAKEENNE